MSEFLDQESEFILFLDDGNDFEKQLIADGFQEEIKQAILSLDRYENDAHRQAREPARVQEVSGFSESELHNIISGKKTKYAPVVSQKIVSSQKQLPNHVSYLFDKVSEILNSDKAKANDE